MKTKEQFKTSIGEFIRDQRAGRTLKEYGWETDTKPGTLSKHEGGVLDFSVVFKHIKTKEDLIKLFEILKDK